MLWYLFCFLLGYFQFGWVSAVMIAALGATLHAMMNATFDAVLYLNLLVFCVAAYFIGGLIPHYRAARRRRPQSK